MRAGLAAICLGAVSIAGCATQPSLQASERVARPTVRPAPPGPVSRQALSPAVYFARAASLHLFVTKASDKIAASDSNLGKAARLIAEDHRGIAAQLSLTGRRLNLLPSTTLLPEHETLLAELESSQDASMIYLVQMHRLLPSAYDMHRNFAARGASPTLRPVAAMAMPIVERHYQTVKGLARPF